MTASLDPLSSWSLLAGVALLAVAGASALGRALARRAADVERTSVPVEAKPETAVLACRDCGFEEYDPGVAVARALAEAAEHSLRTGHVLFVTATRELVVGGP